MNSVGSNSTAFPFSAKQNLHEVTTELNLISSRQQALVEVRSVLQESRVDATY